MLPSVGGWPASEPAVSKTMRVARTVLSPIAARLRVHPMLGRLALGMLPDWGRTIEIAPIGPFRIRLRRHRSYWLRDPLTNERFPLFVLQHWITPNDVVWDVGSNIGLYVRFEVQAFGAGRVIAFEPMSENRHMLERNIQLGGIGDRVTLLPYAVSDHEGAEELQIDDIQSGTAVLDSVAQGVASEGRAAVGLRPKTERVETRTVDQLVAESVAPPPTIMKIDVEGSELHVLSGARATLIDHTVRLQIELHGVEVGRNVVAFLRELGFHVRAKVATHIDPTGYAKADQALLDRLENKYDMHHIVASTCADDLPATAGEYRP